MTTRPFVRPASISSESAGTRSSGSTEVISAVVAAGELLGQPLPGALAQLYSGARTESTPASVTARRMKG